MAWFPRRVRCEHVADADRGESTARPRAESKAAVLEADKGRLASDEFGEVSVAETMPDGRASPEMGAVAKQQVAAVWRAASALPQQQRAVFLLRFLEDLDLLEIAKVTGLKEGTVKTHLFRALQTVRAHVDKTV